MNKFWKIVKRIIYGSAQTPFIPEENCSGPISSVVTDQAERKMGREALGKFREKLQ